MGAPRSPAVLRWLVAVPGVRLPSATAQRLPTTARRPSTTVHDVPRPGGPVIRRADRLTSYTPAARPDAARLLWRARPRPVTRGAERAGTRAPLAPVRGRARRLRTAAAAMSRQLGRGRKLPRHRGVFLLKARLAWGGRPAERPAPRRQRRARWSSPFGPDNAFLRTVAPVVTPLALVGLPSAGSCTGSPHPAAGKRRGRGRPQARRIASSAPRHSAAPRPVSGRLIRKPRYPLHRAHGFAVGAGPGGGAPHGWTAWLWLWRGAVTPRARRGWSTRRAGPWL